MTASSDQEPDADEIPVVHAEEGKRGRISLIWLVPLLAVLIGVSMLVSSWMSQGPTLQISFKDAQGMVAGKTEVKYKNVVIGQVGAVALSDDRSHVLVTVNLDKSAASFATEGSRFWVVKPRVGLGGVSGLGTLLSGAYIGADTGTSTKRKTRFTGMETPPPLTHNEQGTSFTLASNDLGSLTIGSPVYYRRIQVGRVVAYHLDKSGAGVSVQVFVTAPNDRFVTADTRFWNASGVNLSMGATGLKLDTQSLASIISGGIAFAAPEGQITSAAIAAKTHYTLFNSRAAAMQPKDGEPLRLVMRFQQSIRGLEAGAPVDFRGIRLGEVTSVSLKYDPKTNRFPALVKATIYPDRMSTNRNTEAPSESAAPPHASTNPHTNGAASTQQGHHARPHGDKTLPNALIGILVKHGLRAQLRNGNLLAGKLYVALDFFSKAPTVTFDEHATPLELPTMPGSFNKLQEQVADIVTKLDKVPFDKIGQKLDSSLLRLDRLLSKFNNSLAPQVKSTLEEAQQALHKAGQTLSGNTPVGRNLNQTLDDVQRTTRSLRALSDYLTRHPEALLRGRPDATSGTSLPSYTPDAASVQGTSGQASSMRETKDYDQ